jgi:hypothetical protein
MANLSDINPRKKYKPMEIAYNGWITSTGENIYSHYNFVLKEIKTGKLKAINYARGKKGMEYFKVYGSEVLRYLKEVEGLNSDQIATL